ncbi:MAG: TolC family protein [Pseudomonadota bacterium]
MRQTRRTRGLRYALLSLLTLPLLQACTNLGPDYQEPPVEWVADWETSLYGQVSATDLEEEDLAFWWQAFEDPILNTLIESARQENQALRIAALNIVQSRAILGIATGTQYPQLQRANGTWTRVDSWPTEGENDWDRSGFNTYNLGFDIGWELDFWGRYRRSIESADATFFASITNQQDAQVLLTAQVAETYYTWRTLALQIEIAKENAALQERSLEITTTLYDSGQNSELDVQQARTQYLGTLSTIPSLEISLRQVENALSVLLGRQPGDLPELAGLTPALPTLDPVLIDDIPARLLMRRPDIRTAAWQIAAQSAQIGVAEADLYPSISLFGTIGWSGDSFGNTNDALSTGVGPGFTWNLFNYGRLENNVRVQDALLEQAIEGYELTVLQAAREIDDAAISVVKTREQQDILEESLASARRALDISTRRYREGYSDFQRVLDAQRALAASSNNFVAIQGAHINSVVGFYKALGGGWQTVSGEDLLPVETRERMEERSDWDGLLQAPLPLTE